VRPEWLLSKFRNAKQISPMETGEWCCVWQPKSRLSSPTKPTRKVLRTLRDDEEREILKEKLKQDTLMKIVAENLDASSLIAPRKGEAGHGSELVLPPIHQMRKFHAGFSSADAKTSGTARSSSSLSPSKKYVQVKVIDDNNPQTSASSREALRTGSTTAFSSRRSKSSMVCSPVPFMLSIVMKICLSVGVWRCDSRYTMTRVKVVTRHCRIKASFWIGSKVLRMPCLRRRRCAKKCSFCCSRNQSRTQTAVHDIVPRPVTASSPAGSAAHHRKAGA
jgi:hypothetical protein